MKKTVKKRSAIPSAQCKAPRLQKFAQHFLKALAPMDDTVIGAETLRGMVTRSMPAEKRRQFLSARIALLARENPQPPPPEPVVVMAEPEPVPPAEPEPVPVPLPVVSKKKPQTSVLSLDEAAQLFSAFSFGDPDEAPSSAPTISVAPEPPSAQHDLEIIEETVGSFEMETIGTETAEPLDLEPTEIPKKKSGKGQGQNNTPARKKSKKAPVAGDQADKTPKAAPEEAAPEAVKAAPAAVVPEALRARRSGESRIISADGPSPAKPMIDFSMLASLSDLDPEPEEPKADPEPVFKPGLMIDLSAANLLTSFADEEDEEGGPKPA